MLLNLLERCSPRSVTTTEFDNVIEMFKAAYENELIVSQAINELVNLSLEEKDHQTNQFMQWYVAEQHEEEMMFRNLIDRMNLIGLEGQGLYFMDQMVNEYKVEEA